MNRIGLQCHADVDRLEGRLAIDLAEQLGKAGHDVVLSLMSVKSGLPAGFAGLLTKGRSPDPKLSLIVDGGRPDKRTLTESGRMVAWVTKVVPRPDGLEWALVCDALIATSRDVKGLLQEHCPATKVRVVQPGYNAVMWPETPRENGRPPVFGVMADRDPKSMEPVVDAFLDARAALPAGTRLKVIGGRTTQVKGPVEVVPVPEDGNRDWLIDTFAKVDVLVDVDSSLSDGGWAVRFASTGGPVIGGAWGPRRDWMTSDQGWLVPKMPSTRRMEPDPVILASTIVEAANDHRGRREKGRSAAGVVNALLDWPVVVHRLVREAWAE